MLVNCEMGDWEDWSPLECSNADENCGDCKRTRIKPVAKECANGGDCDCKEEEDVDENNKPCRKRVI